MSLTPWIVRYRVCGLERGAGGKTIAKNKVIFKVSRTELAELAMRIVGEASDVNKHRDTTRRTDGKF